MATIYQRLTWIQRVKRSAKLFIDLMPVERVKSFITSVGTLAAVVIHATPLRQKETNLFCPVLTPMLCKFCVPFKTVIASLSMPHFISIYQHDLTSHLVLFSMLDRIQNSPSSIKSSMGKCCVVITSLHLIRLTVWRTGTS